MNNNEIEFSNWVSRQFAPPSPNVVKRLVLLRNARADGVWVETGTYLGETTHVLAQAARHVYTIEPQTELFEHAVNQFVRTQNVTVLHGESGKVLPELLPGLDGDVNFWLDGHYSAGGTYRGAEDTPVVQELELIQTHLPRLSNAVIMIDDIRLFDRRVDPAYPELDYLVDWARRNQMKWHIEHDIFVAKTDTNSKTAL